MISFKIITQELYDYFQKHQKIAIHQIDNLIQHNNNITLSIEQIKLKNNDLEVQLELSQGKNIQLQEKVNILQKKLTKAAGQLSTEIQKSKQSYLKNSETTKNYNAVLIQKLRIQTQNEELIKKITVLEQCLILQNSKIINLGAKEHHLQKRITELSQIIQNLNQQKDQILVQVNKKSATIQNLNSVLKQRTELIEKLASEYQTLKQQKSNSEQQLKILKQSPVSKLQEILKGKEQWINQLTQNISQLKQRCIELEMNGPRHSIPILKNKTGVIKNYETSKLNTSLSKPNVDENQRLKYLTVCKQLLQQFNSKLKKIQQQKKGIQDKYQSIRLKINQYQYNEFKYKDKLSLYLQKIERYQKLTQKQQAEMEKLIFQFDQELDTVIKMKQEQIKSKMEEQISRYQNEYNRLKDQVELEFLKEQQKNKEYAKQRDEYKNQVEFQSADSFEVEIYKQQLQSVKKELKKYKQSKRKYKTFKEQLQAECQKYSNQTRRYRYLLQQLWKQLDIKTNENEILKSNMGFNSGSNGSSGDNGHRSNGYGNSRLTNGQDFYENLSSRLSARNLTGGAKKSGSDNFEYQTSEIDLDIQRKNQLLINKIMLEKYQLFKQNPAGPIADNDFSLFKKKNQGSQLSSQSQNDSSIQSSSSSNNSPNNSISSKNSYKSYGIKYLYKDNRMSTQNSQQRYLLHKNSLQ